MTNPYGHPENDDQQDDSRANSNSNFDGVGNNPYGQFQNYPQDSAINEGQGSAYQGYGSQGYPQENYLHQQPAGTFEATASLGQAWAVFKESPVAWVLATLIFGLVGIALFSVGWVPYMQWWMDAGSEFTPGMTPPKAVETQMLMGGILMGIVSTVLQVLLVRNAVAALGGKKIGLGDFFRFNDIGKMLLVAFTISALAQAINYVPFVGALLNLVLGFFLAFAVVAASNPQMSYVDSFKSSFQVVKRNWVQVLLLGILGFFVSFLGVMLFVIGLLVTIPLVSVAYTHAYLTATGAPMAQRT